MAGRRILIPRLCRRFWRADEGNTAVEFSFAITFVLALIFAALDISRVYIVSGLLGDSVRRISRENQVLETPRDSAAFDAAADVIIASKASGFIDVASVAVTTTVYASFDDLAAGVAVAGGAPGGSPGQIVKYRLTYNMDYLTPFIDLLFEGAEFSHTAEIIVYNEPETQL